MKKKLIIYFGSIIIGVILIIVLSIKQVNNFNNGICKNCNNNYELVSVSNGVMYYECSHCHNVTPLSNYLELFVK